jgi:elongation factor 1-gamma
MKLYGFPMSGRVSLCSIVLQACGVDHEVQWVSMEEVKTETFLKLNPQGKIPVLETPEGPIYESLAIVRHAARVGQKLGGESVYEQALVDQWLSWVMTELSIVFPQFLYQTYGFDMPHLTSNLSEIKRAREAFIGHLTFLDQQLEGKSALVGSALTIADYAVVASIYQALAFTVSADERAKLGNVTKLVAAVAETAPFKKWYGRVRYVDTPAQIPKKAKVEKVEKKKEEKPKKEDQPMDADELAKEPKKDETQFPESALNLMTFKTFFINEPDRDVAIAKFWEEFKDGEWSLWHLKYIKYPGEGEKVYRTNNLLRTFLDRLEQVRKHIFGTHMILGDEPSLDIEGVWLVRGPELFKEITEIDVYDTYEWVKLDSTKDADRLLLKDFWTHKKEDEEQVQGKTIRTFKWIK